jgi:hypothetical protein
MRRLASPGPLALIALAGLLLLDSEFLGFCGRAAAERRFGPPVGGGESVIVTLLVVAVGVVVIGGFAYAIIADAIDNWQGTLAFLVFGGIVLSLYVFAGLGFWQSVVSVIAVFSALMLLGSVYLKLRGEPDPQGTRNGETVMYLAMTCVSGGGAYWLAT